MRMRMLMIMRRRLIQVMTRLWKEECIKESKIVVTRTRIRKEKIYSKLMIHQTTSCRTVMMTVMVMVMMVMMEKLTTPTKTTTSTPGLSMVTPMRYLDRGKNVSRPKTNNRRLRPRLKPITSNILLFLNNNNKLISKVKKIPSVNKRLLLGTMIPSTKKKRVALMRLLIQEKMRMRMRLRLRMVVTTIMRVCVTTFTKIMLLLTTTTQENYTNNNNKHHHRNSIQYSRVLQSKLLNNFKFLFSGGDGWVTNGFRLRDKGTGNRI
mmetsp:Transcript_18556/g.20414  ORF Transcript_18556/g.20414 Transcript_18556/m.20414 type:complete len:264 (+) Transcript_18556:1145-1936(+)